MTTKQSKQTIADHLVDSFKDNKEIRKHKQLSDVSQKIERSKSLLMIYNKMHPMFKPLEDIASKDIVRNLIQRSHYVQACINGPPEKKIFQKETTAEQKKKIPIGHNLLNKIKISSELPQLPEIKPTCSSTKLERMKLRGSSSLSCDILRQFPVSSRILLPQIESIKEEEESVIPLPTSKGVKKVELVSHGSFNGGSTSRRSIDTLYLTEMLSQNK
jgi:hypothetical protein